MSIIMMLLELYKQLSFSYDNGVWSYEWYAFPFQFCSTPMYIVFIASLIKNDKLKNSLYMFLATYGLTAGISVMLYPNTVFIKEFLIDVQTMVHHGFMVVMGLFLILTNKVESNFKSIRNSFIVFIVLVLIALIGNISTYYLGIDNGLELFYISPFHTPVLPIFDIIYEYLPYPLFLFIYIFIFSVGSLIPIGLINGIKKIKK